MAAASTHRASRPPVGVVEALGTAVPPHVVTNDDLAQHLDTNDEWVRTRTGIAERRFADPDTSTGDLAVEAGADALKAAGGDVDTVIVATTTPDRMLPGTAPEVASRLGLGDASAFDVNAACAGFIYALPVASGLVATGTADRVLVIGAEVMSRIVDPDDRSTRVLFGDGAGAVVVRSGHADEPGAVGPFDLGSDGDQTHLLEVPAGGTRQPIDDHAIENRHHFLQMDGREVYRQAVRRMVSSSRAVLAQAGLEVDDVDCLIAHQANARILEAVADRLEIPRDRCVSNVGRYGNTSAASIPLALADASLEPGQQVLLTSFGAGMAWGSSLMTWPDLPTPDPT
ncbi:ketoacyl-ACP synthase III [Egibacter rhizosphaerae]|uniref:Beta-ketoacyl-[acyl-carrier-protein] synthase III n=1 Tax=Egibacter rhizosphaerae TaxID=1670831 RepID=A0A411YKI1_9ACTN|nr:beta-ketoacyl-ACP synthase III [Egibacter rhizosphaerae]QBI21696.1 ketoacyl-ACP synthase III [Egibacter rhizosphaerae]